MGADQQLEMGQTSGVNPPAPSGTSLSASNAPSTTLAVDPLVPIGTGLSASGVPSLLAHSQRDMKVEVNVPPPTVTGISATSAPSMFQMSEQDVKLGAPPPTATGLSATSSRSMFTINKQDVMTTYCPTNDPRPIDPEIGEAPKPIVPDPSLAMGAERTINSDLQLAIFMAITGFGFLATRVDAAIGHVGIAFMVFGLIHTVWSTAIFLLRMQFLLQGKGYGEATKFLDTRVLVCFKAGIIILAIVFEVVFALTDPTRFTKPVQFADPI